jgi:hypothetical protein
MTSEYQKDVKFDEVQVGDLILVELFEADGSYVGDRRGVAKVRIGDMWHFDGMFPVYKEALGYRMFKVTDLSGPATGTTVVETAELLRLRKIEAALKDLTRCKRQSRDNLLEDARACRDEWQIEDALHYERMATKTLNEITGLEMMINA